MITSVDELVTRVEGGWVPAGTDVHVEDGEVVIIERETGCELVRFLKEEEAVGGVEVLPEA